LVQVQLAPLSTLFFYSKLSVIWWILSISEKTVDAHTMHIDSLKGTAGSSTLKDADMRGIQKIKNKDGSCSNRA